MKKNLTIINYYKGLRGETDADGGKDARASALALGGKVAGVDGLTGYEIDGAVGQETCKVFRCTGLESSG